MRKALSIIKKTTLSIAMLVMTLGFPLSGVTISFAADECTAPADSTYGNGVHHPVGSDAGTFVYQCGGTYKGKWTNTYYVYDPVTNSRAALYDPAYSYDCTAQQWYRTEYDYSATSGAYMKNRVATSAPSGLDTGCPAPALAADTSGGSGGSGAGGAGTISTNAATGPSTGTGSPTISNTGPGSSNTTSGSGTIVINGANNNTMNMGNTITQQSTTGAAGVFYNTGAGDATSGNAQSIANIANLLQSSANVFGPNTATFVSNINGDVNGDFMFDPNAVVNTGPGSNNSATGNNNLTVNQNNNTNAGITNDVNVGANSGDATVAGNTSGGNATSGTATAVANLMNLINSTVASGKSFVGVININGNLNGDILLPPGLVDQLLASTGPGSTNTAGNNTNLNVTDTNNTNENIANNVNTTAASGTANVSNNTNAGTATSGSATTNVTLLNLTGSQVVGANDLLVFVNVLGHWVGMIVNAPTGSTAAELGGGITSSGPGSTNNIGNNTNLNANSITNNNLGITNNVNVHAGSGNANVTGNTLGGNATSGNAASAVNILNIANTDLSLSNWFGVLFINVFGDWTGSFGVNTSAGDPATTPTTPAPGTSGGSGGTSAATHTARTFATFFASGGGSGGSDDSSGTSGDPINTPNVTPPVPTQVLGTSTTKPAARALPTPDNKTHASYLVPAIGVSIAILMLAGERVVAIRNRRREREEDAIFQD